MVPLAGVEWQEADHFPACHSAVHQVHAGSMCVTPASNPLQWRHGKVVCTGPYAAIAQFWTTTAALHAMHASLELAWLPCSCIHACACVLAGWSQQVHLYAVGARGLKSVQALGKQDPFLEVALAPCIPPLLKGAPASGATARTRAAADSGANAVWNEALQVCWSCLVLVDALRLQCPRTTLRASL